MRHIFWAKFDKVSWNFSVSFFFKFKNVSTVLESAKMHYNKIEEVNRSFPSGVTENYVFSGGG